MNYKTRRNFLRQTAQLAAGAWVYPYIIKHTNNPSDEIRMGIIGMGSRGTGLAVLMKKIPGLKVIACCDILPERLEAGIRTGAPGAKAYTDYRKLLDNKEVDAVLIATPLFLHFPMAKEALLAGKHIYLEKSMTYSIPEALELTRLVRNSPLIFQLGFQYRYYGLYKRVKEIIRQNWLGKITHIESQYNRNSDWRNPVTHPDQEKIINWRMYKEYCGGPLSELCAHQIDMVQFLLDARPESVVGMGGINYWKDGRSTYDHIRTIYDYPGGIKSSVSSVLSNAYNGYNIKIYGDQATVEIQREEAFIYAESLTNERGIVDGVTGATISTATQGKAQKIEFLQAGETLLEPTTYALSEFRDCIVQNKKPASGIDNGRSSSIAIHMGNIAAETGQIQYWKKEYDL